MKSSLFFHGYNVIYFKNAPSCRKKKIKTKKSLPFLFWNFRLIGASSDMITT